MMPLNNFQKRLVTASLVGLSLFLVAGSVYAQNGTQNPEVAVLPSTLERISWGGIIAGTILAIVIQLAGNLLAIGLGVSRINPNPSYGEHPDSVQDIGTSSIVMMAITVLVSLFIGGYVAARFAGSPDNGDALLNGLMVWGLDTVITLFLLTSTLGAMFSGLSGLLGHGVRLIGSTTSAVAQGAATVAQGALSAAGNAAGAMGNAVQDVTNRAEDAAQNAIRNNPDLQRLTREQDTVVQRIQDEAMRLVSQAGVDPNRLKGEAQGAVQDVQQTVKDAAQQVQQNPTHAQQIVTDTLNRLFQRGQQVAGQVTEQVSQVDRDKLVDVLAQRGNISREEAQQQLAKWEGEYNRVRQQGEQTLLQARQQAERLQAEATQKLEQARRDAERTAREAAETTAKVISRLALAGFAAIVIGAVAAGLGGVVGAPDTIPTAQVEVGNNNNRGAVDTLVDNTNATPVISATATTAP